MVRRIQYFFSIIIFIGSVSIFSDAVLPCKVDEDCKKFDIICQQDAIAGQDSVVKGREVFCKNSSCVCDFRVDKKQEKCEKKTAHPPSVLRGLNKFGINIFREIIKGKSNENILISPLSIFYALSIAYNGAGGETKEAFEKTLLPEESWCLGEEDIVKQVNKYLSDLMATLMEKDSNVTLNIANSLWARKDIEFKEDFFAKTREYYKARIESLDFNNDAVNIINDWVKNNTNGKIEKIIETFSPDDILHVINAIYFKGIWKYKFDSKNTKEDDFNLLDKSKKKVSFMNIDFKFKREEVNYYSNDDFQLIELPYSSNYSMYIFLPSENSSLEKFYTNLTDENIKKWLSELRAAEGHLSIPKFKLEYNEELNKTLKKLGLEIAFDPKRADFSNMCKVSKELNVHISKVKHKTFVEVNEEGTEAAAVTDVIYVLRHVEKFNFIANRPFFFLIMNKKNGAFLLMGSVVNP